MAYEQLKNKKLSELQRNRLNAIYCRLLSGLATKDELMRIIGVKDEHVVRDCISIIKKRFPVISLSGEKGYRIAKSLENLEDAKHMIASETSRANEVIDNLVELKKFVSRMEA